MTRCTICFGRGFLPEDNISSRECECRYRLRKRLYLGRQLFDADRILSSPLMRRSEDRRSLVYDGTQVNTWLTAPSHVLLAHLRYVLGVKWHLSAQAFTFRLITDAQIVMSCVDKAHEQSLEELVSGVDLLVLRTGFMAWRNSAGPSALLAAARLCMEGLGQRLWVCDAPDVRFEKGYFCWDDRVASYLSAHLGRVTEADLGTAIH